MHKILYTCKSIIVSIIVVGVLSAYPAFAGTNSIVLKKATLQSGYTVINDDGTMQIGLPPKSIVKTKRVKVSARKANKPERYPVGDNELLSDIHIYSVKSYKKFKLKRKLWVKLSYPDQYKNTDKVVMYWNAKKGKWKKLKTSDNSRALQVSAGLKRKHAVLGVFARPKETTGDVVEGIASWYDGNGTASNDFPIGSTVRTTNVSTGVYVDSVVTGTGPFVPGRVIDLSRDDFAAIASISSGVVNVRVQAVE